VKRFAESLGGRVSVDSTHGIGTRFTIELPVAA
jgi:signal transduction histidine kinase